MIYLCFVYWSKKRIFHFHIFLPICSSLAFERKCMFDFALCNHPPPWLCALRRKFNLPPFHLPPPVWNSHHAEYSFLYSMHNCVSVWNVPKSPKGIDPCIRWPISYPLKKIPETKVNKEDKLTSLLCWSGFQRRSQIPRGGLKESHSGLDAELWNATDMTDIPDVCSFHFKQKKEGLLCKLLPTLWNFDGVVVFHVLRALKHRIDQNIADLQDLLVELGIPVRCSIGDQRLVIQQVSLPLTFACSKSWAEDKWTQDKW